MMGDACYMLLQQNKGNRSFLVYLPLFLKVGQHSLDF
jgi:hypothetical protein